MKKCDFTILRLSVFTLIACLSLCLPVHAAQTAGAGRKDNARPDARIQTETYDASRVYTIYAQVGRAALIQLEEGEALSASPASILGMGDAQAWSLAARGNNILFKPVENLPDTNLVFTTNRRTYAFDLRMVRRGGKPTYIMRFEYPDTQAALAAEDARIAKAAKAGPVFINTDYVWRGANALLKPTAAWDDGRFTRLEYDHAGELPAFFKVLPDGTEALINSNIDASDRKTVILHEVIRAVRARLGNDVIEIVNNAYLRPKLNAAGTGEHGTVRVEKGAGGAENGR